MLYFDDVLIISSDYSIYHLLIIPDSSFIIYYYIYYPIILLFIIPALTTKPAQYIIISSFSTYLCNINTNTNIDNSISNRCRGVIITTIFHNIQSMINYCQIFMLFHSVFIRSSSFNDVLANMLFIISISYSAIILY